MVVTVKGGFYGNAQFRARLKIGFRVFLLGSRRLQCSNDEYLGGEACNLYFRCIFNTSSSCSLFDVFMGTPFVLIITRHLSHEKPNIDCT
jgi:hypothetical protein